jgi:hypothetical protein
MDYRKKVLEIDIIYDVGVQKQEFEHIVGKLQRVKASFSNDEDYFQAISDIVMNLRNNPLHIEQQKSALAVYQICPICGKGCERVSLSKTREAYYCKNHKVALPIAVE